MSASKSSHSRYQTLFVRNGFFIHKTKQFNQFDLLKVVLYSILHEISVSIHVKKEIDLKQVSWDTHTTSRYVQNQSLCNWACPICTFCIEVETTAHYLLHCPNYLSEKAPIWTTSNLSFLIFWKKLMTLLLIISSL